MKPNQPNELPLNINYGKIARTLARAQYALGRLDGRQRNLHNPKLLIAPLTAKEATVSSRIEGTQSTVSDVFLHEAGEVTRFSDVVQISNYRKAINNVLDELQSRPISLNLIKDAHRVLLDNTRGAGRRGDFRIDQVWIGKEGDPIEKATYIPPIPELVEKYMYNLESYINSDTDDVLIQAALIHYQFEAVHPFNDGNGRIGRLLIPIILYFRNKISLPILYLSGYFDDYKDKYLDALHHVDVTKEYEDWINYFLEAVIVQSEQTESLINKILGLFDETKSAVEDVKSPYMLRIIDCIFKKPIFNTSSVVSEIHAHKATVLRLLNVLVERGILVELAKTSNRNLYAFRKLVALL